MITIIAHFNKGTTTPFPSKLKGISGEGSVFTNENLYNGGGVIVVSYNTFDAELVFQAFKEHLAENDMSAFAMQKVGDEKFFFSWTQSYIF